MVIEFALEQVDALTSVARVAKDLEIQSNKIKRASKENLKLLLERVHQLLSPALAVTRQSLVIRKQPRDLQISLREDGWFVSGKEVTRYDLFAVLSYITIDDIAEQLPDQIEVLLEQLRPVGETAEDSMQMIIDNTQEYQKIKDLLDFLDPKEQESED